MQPAGKAALSDPERADRLRLARTFSIGPVTFRRLLDRFHSAAEALRALPGVGRKTASVVLNELRIEPAIAVDTHVFRVSHRLGLSSGKTPDQVEAELMAIVPDPLKTRAHHWLILHGRYVCVARRPKCEICLVADLCPSRELFLGA